MTKLRYDCMGEVWTSSQITGKCKVVVKGNSNKGVF